LDEVGQDGYPPVLDKLKSAAQQRGLWNLFLPHLRPGNPGTPLSNLDYAPISEMLGKVTFASEVLNCNAPDTGNMEILSLYGSDEIKATWLEPLLAGEIRSAFCMTEPDSASSDATNIELSIDRDGDEYVLNGRKWFSSGARAERCKVFIVMGKTEPEDASRHLQQSMIVVPKDTPGVELGLDPHVFGYVDRGGHPEVIYRNVRVPVVQPARRRGQRLRDCPRPAWARGASTTACARSASRSGRLELMVIRSARAQHLRHEPRPQGAHPGLDRRVAHRDRDGPRLLTLKAAWLMDTVGNRHARTEIAGIKVAIRQASR
jgi:acyl-CoA dehydrogenase